MPIIPPRLLPKLVTAGIAVLVPADINPLAAQSVSSPEFEVASIKLNTDVRHR